MWRPPPAAWSPATTGGPCFLADAVADPLAGLVAAAAVLEALAAGGRWLIDAAMAPMAAAVAGPALVDVARRLRGARRRRARTGRPLGARLRRLGCDTGARCWAGSP